MYIASIDIGIINLGLVAGVVSWELIDIDEVHLVDLTRTCRRRGCTLEHSNHLVDRVNHFIQGYKHILDKAEKILIEKQPIQGLISVEQLLFDRLRDKVIFIYPVSLHKQFGIRHLNYDERKEFLVSATRSHLEGTIFDTLERKHDVADAMAMIIYWRRHTGKKVPQVVVQRENPFEQFRYCGDT